MYLNQKTIIKLNNINEAEATIKNTNISKLPNNIIIKKSKYGLGCFAKNNIPKNTILGLAFRGNTPSTTKRTELGANTNHSCTPNAKLVYKKDSKGITEIYFKSTKNIKKGEEILINYNEFKFEGKRDFAKC